MTCKDIQIMLIEKMFGKLAAADEVRLEEHLRTCPACRALARRSPDLSSPKRAEGDVPLPDKETLWRAIFDRTAREQRKVRSVFWKWAAAAAGSAAIVLLAVMAGKAIFVRPGEKAPLPLSAAIPAGSPFPAYAEGLEMVLLSTLNGAGLETLTQAESRLVDNLLLQTRLLKQVVARWNNPLDLKLVDDIEMILLDLSNRKAGDRESREFLSRVIKEKDLKFRLQALSGLNVRL